MTQQFNEAEHPRGQAGRFTEKQQTDPGSSVLATADANQFGCDDWTKADWTPTDEDPDIIQLTGPGTLYASIAVTEVPTHGRSSDYDLPATWQRHEWMIADSNTGRELVSGWAGTMRDAQRNAQHYGQEIVAAEAARAEWDWTNADKEYIKDRADALIGDEVRAYCIGMGTRQALLGVTGRIVSTSGSINAKVEFRGPLFDDKGKLAVRDGDVLYGQMPYNLLLRRKRSTTE